MAERPAKAADAASNVELASMQGAGTHGLVEGAKRAPNLRRWMVVTANGGTSLFTSPKLDISPYTGVHLQLRDLRLLDPLLTTSYPSAILTRNGAIVANLESIKLVITTEKAFLTNLEDETVANFATELCRRLQAADRQRQQEQRQQQQVLAAAAVGGQLPPPPAQQADSGVGQLQLPFELQVLEVALEMACARLEKLAADLEAEAHPVLDAMTAKVTQGALENERRVKNKLVRLATRVETLKEVLEKLLEDEDDMRDMNLSAVAAERLAVLTRRTAALEGRSGELTPALSHSLAGPGSYLRGAHAYGSSVGAGAGWEPEGVGSAARTPGRADSVASSDSSEWEDAAVEVVEALLQSFFFTVDAVHYRLRQLQEYVEDTEDLVAMELDSARNSLVRLDMVLTCVNASMSLIIAVSAIFAMNLEQSPDWASNLDDSGAPQTQGPYWEFVLVNSLSSAGAILIFVAVMALARWRRLI